MNIKECEVIIDGVFGYTTKVEMEKKLKIKYADRATVMCYIVWDPETKESLIIDPGGEAKKIIKAAEGLKVKAIVLSHVHYGHVAAFPEIAAALKIPLFVHESDVKFFRKLIKHFIPPEAEEKVRLLKEGDMIKFGNKSLKVIHTPGHSPGSICLYDGEGALFTGDILFAGAHGGGNHRGGSLEDTRNSLKKIFALPPETKVYPGHGPKTTIGKERNQVSD